jgi:hypothetical protein
MLEIRVYDVDPIKGDNNTIKRGKEIVKLEAQTLPLDYHRQPSRQRRGRDL